MVAQQVGGEIVAISAWNTSLVYNYEVPIGDDFVHMLQTSIAKIVDDAVGDSAEVQQIIVHDHPAHALLEHARNANLLVPGTRGHYGFAGALLGSVGQHCVQHAPCPVLIVRQPAKS